jgi:hypothetical protein
MLERCKTKRTFRFRDDILLIFICHTKSILTVRDNLLLRLFQLQDTFYFGWDAGGGIFPVFVPFSFW